MLKRIAIPVSILAVVLSGLLVWRLQTSKTPTTQSAASPTVTASKPIPLDAMSQTVEGIVARYRKTIVLLEDDESLPDADRERSSLVGKIIFQENHPARSNL